MLRALETNWGCDESRLLLLGQCCKLLSVPRSNPYPFDCQRTLATKDVIGIHEYVVDFFAEEDPVYPGIRDENLLDSAVSRPLTGCPARPKYFSVHLAAATLTYGLTKNHPFLDGNKRTAVIAMLAFLDLWKLQLKAEITSDDLYQLMVALTEDRLHEFAKVSKLALDIDSNYIRCLDTLRLPGSKAALKKELRVRKLENPDLSVFILSSWLSRNTRKKDMRDRRVTLRELERILSKFNARLEKVDGTTYTVIIRRPSEVRRSWLGFRKLVKEGGETPCYRLHVGGKNRLIGIDQIKGLRRSCKLEGYDYHSFYGDRTPADYFLLEHARVLRKLAKYDRGEA